MVRMLGEEREVLTQADRLREHLPRDPVEAGFRRLAGGGSLEYEAMMGSDTLRVHCDVITKDGRRWLSLGINKYPLIAGLRDVSFVRRSFLGPDKPALIHYGPDHAGVPTGNPELVLWMPIDEAILPSGHYRSAPA